MQGDKHWRVARLEASGVGGLRDNLGLHPTSVRPLAPRWPFQQPLRPRLQGQRLRYRGSWGSHQGPHGHADNLKIIKTSPFFLLPRSTAVVILACNFCVLVLPLQYNRIPWYVVIIAWEGLMYDINTQLYNTYVSVCVLYFVYVWMLILVRISSGFCV